MPEVDGRWPMADEVQVSGDAVQRTEEYRRRKETAVLAIAFSDIVGSTDLLESMGEQRYGSLLDAHKARVEEIVTRDDAGSVVQFMGDGALSVFSEPSTAVERCVELSRSSAPFSLRIGLDLGQVAKKEAGGTVQDIFGRHVHRAARVQSAAHPGEVLTSFQIYDCAVGWLRGTPIAWEDRGLHTLKGFTEPVHLFAASDPRDGRIPRPSRLSDLEVPEQHAGFDRLRGRTVPNDFVQLLKFPLISKLGAEISALVHADAPGRFRKRDDLPKTAVGPRGWLGRILLPWNRREKARDALILGDLEGVRGTAPRVPTEVPSILWIDYFPINNQQLAFLLRACGFQVELALDALRSLAKHSFTAIITDLGRPSGPSAGLDLLRTLRERNNQTPVLVYSSTSAIATYGDEARELGAYVATSGTVTLVDSLKSILVARGSVQTRPVS